jgi:hypothetical protein
VVVTGTIVRNGGDYVLHHSSGTVFRLEAPEKAQPFEGKPDRVTGKLNQKQISSMWMLSRRSTPDSTPGLRRSIPA